MKIMFIVPDGGSAARFGIVIESLAKNRHKVLVAVDDASDPAANAVLRSYVRFPGGVRVEVVTPEPRRGSLVWDVVRRQTTALKQHCASLGRSGTQTVERFCAWVQGILPLDNSIKLSLLTHEPDVVLIASTFADASRHADYVKASRSLGILTGIFIGHEERPAALQTIPDRLFVWNEAQKSEAVALGGVPEKKVVVAGAPGFDLWFDATPSRSREAFCDVAGLDPTRYILLYVAAMNSRPEVAFVLGWLRALRGCGDPRLRTAGILIRPNPGARKLLKEWDRPEFKEFGNVSVFPPGRRVSLEKRSFHDHYDSVYHAAAVVTGDESAKFEVAIVGRPLLTFSLDDLKGTRALAGFGLEAHVEQLCDKLSSPQADGPASVGSLLRPYGIAQPITPIVIAEIEEMEDLTAVRPSLAARLGWLQRALLWPFAALIAATLRIALALGEAIGPRSLVFPKTTVRKLVKSTGVKRLRPRLGAALRRMGLLEQRVPAPKLKDEARADRRQSRRKPNPPVEMSQAR